MPNPNLILKILFLKKISFAIFNRSTTRCAMKNWIFTTAFFALFNLALINFAYSNENQRPTAVIETNRGTIEVQLFSDLAPKAVENFTKLAQEHYYDGTIFHRVIKNFMIQGGDPLGNGTGGQSIWGKPFKDEFSPSLTFDKGGYLAMANSGPNTNGSQFFITTAAAPWLNRKHTIFGKVTKGYDVVKKIEKTPIDSQDRPLDQQKILSITITGSELTQVQ
jgi:peptidylprolyl isomerase